MEIRNPRPGSDLLSMLELHQLDLHSKEADISAFAEMMFGPAENLSRSGQQARMMKLAPMLASDGRTFAFLLKMEQQPIGMAYLNLCFSADEGGFYALVERIYLSPDARGKGWGTLLGKGLLQWAAQQQCVAVKALTASGNAVSQNLVRKLGFSLRQNTWMEKKL